MGSIVKHCLGLCFFFVLGFVVGLLPLGLLYSVVTGDWDLGSSLYGGMMGAVGLSFTYVAICLRGRFSVIGDLFKHLPALCLLFVLGFVDGLLSIGLLNSYLTVVWVKGAPLYGGMTGAVGLSIAYVAICLRGRFDRQQDPERTERLIKYLLGGSFFIFLGVVLGLVLELCDLDSSQVFCSMGGFCVSIGCFAYWYSVKNRRKDTKLQH